MWTQLVRSCREVDEVSKERDPILILHNERIFFIPSCHRSYSQILSPCSSSDMFFAGEVAKLGGSSSSVESTTSAGRPFNASRWGHRFINEEEVEGFQSELKIKRWMVRPLLRSLEQMSEMSEKTCFCEREQPPRRKRWFFWQAAEMCGWKRRGRSYPLWRSVEKLSTPQKLWMRKAVAGSRGDQWWALKQLLSGHKKSRNCTKKKLHQPLNQTESFSHRGTEKVAPAHKMSHQAKEWRDANTYTVKQMHPAILTMFFFFRAHKWQITVVSCARSLSSLLPSFVVVVSRVPHVLNYLWQPATAACFPSEREVNLLNIKKKF